MQKTKKSSDAITESVAKDAIKLIDKLIDDSEQANITTDDYHARQQKIQGMLDKQKERDKSKGGCLAVVMFMIAITIFL